LQYNATTGTYRIVSQKPMVSAPIAAPIAAVRIQPNGIVHRDQYEHSLASTPVNPTETRSDVWRIGRFSATSLRGE